ncbi:MAG TPA: FIST N-terminal domain-containing protein [Candidatus Omnitrophota bacterium]|nr:FIST N-terminal domain-containing protein [Candidatus Omnitrophota bacterium]HQJ15536.1 FIST N-terminal domain-containing protein [Candidatus Omnitrophota bacterium]
MIDIGTGASIDKNDVAAVEGAIRQAKTKKVNKEKIDLAFVFHGPDRASSAIIKNTSALLPNVPVIGGTASGFFAHQSHSKRGVVIMLITFPEGVFLTTGDVEGISAMGALAAGEQLGDKLLSGFKNVPRSLALLLFDRLTQDNADFIVGLQEKLGTSFPCVGASISNPEDSGRSDLLYNKKLLRDACAGILFGGKISFGLGLRHGWKPLGKPHVISSVSGNIIHKIDNEPAVRLYEEYLAYDFPRIRKELKNLSVLYPIGIKIAGQSEYLLRSIQAINSDGSLVCRGNIPAGSTTRLMISTKETCLEATRAAVDEAKANLGAQALKFHREKTSKLVIVFDSFPRAASLGKDILTELKIIADAFEPGTGIIGVNSFGELAPLSTQSYHGQTYFQNQMVSVLIIEG